MAKIALILSQKGKKCRLAFIPSRFGGKLIRKGNEEAHLRETKRMRGQEKILDMQTLKGAPSHVISQLVSRNSAFGKSTSLIVLEAFKLGREHPRSRHRSY